MNLSRIISGTMNWGSWGSNYSSKEISELIKCAYENGIHSFDHADIVFCSSYLVRIATTIHHCIPIVALY